MFGPRGLLAKIEAEEEQDSPIELSLNGVNENRVDLNPCHEKPFVSEPQESCYKSDQFNQNVQVSVLSLIPKPIEPIAAVPLSSLSPVEAAFSIEKISETIFSLLEPSELLECRLVSSTWLRMATNENLLRKYKDAIWIRYRAEKEGRVVLARVKNQKRELKDVTEFLDNLGSHPCLYSADLNLNMTIAPNDFFHFFDRYGFVVTKLNIGFQTIEDSKEFVYQMNLLLEFVTKLLTEQMPNLEDLSVGFLPETKFAGEIDPKLLLSMKKGLYFSERKQNRLRTISAYGRTPFEIIEAMCSLAPKLEKLEFSNDLGFWAKNKHRLYLLKKLHLRPLLDNWDEVVALESIVCTEKKVDLRKFTTDFFEVREHPEVWPRLATLFRKILEMSCHSIEELHLRKVCFLPGTVLPRMSKVKELSLIVSTWECGTPEWNFLPQGTSLAETFPFLEILTFDRFTGSNLITDFLSFCKNEEVASVKKIYAFGCSNYEKRICKGRFPNAKIVDTFEP